MFKRREKRDVYDGHLTKQGWSGRRYQNEDGHLTKKKTVVSEDGESLERDRGKQWVKGQTQHGVGASEDKPKSNVESICDNHLNQMDLLIRQMKDSEVKVTAANICVRSKQIMFYRTSVTKEGIERFLLYYVPTTRELLASYVDLEQHDLEEEKNDIRDLLNTAQHSFDTFVEKLSQGKMIDVEEDISGFEMLLSRF